MAAVLPAYGADGSAPGCGPAGVVARTLHSMLRADDARSLDGARIVPGSGHYRLVDAQGVERGSMSVTVHGRILSIDNAFVDEEYLRRGIYRALLARALRDHPAVRRISSELIATNQRELEAALARGLTLREALMETPSYRIRAALGFGRIPNIPENQSGALLVTDLGGEPAAGR